MRSAREEERHRRYQRHAQGGGEDGPDRLGVGPCGWTPVMRCGDAREEERHHRLYNVEPKGGGEGPAYALGRGLATGSRYEVRQHQGGGEVSPLLQQQTSGRRRRSAVFGKGGAVRPDLRYLVRRYPGRRRGYRRLFQRPQGGGEGPLIREFLFAVGGVECDRLDHRAVDAQIRQFATA